MASEQTRERFRLLVPIVALVGFTASMVEILNYFEVKPKDIPALLARAFSTVRPGSPEPFEIPKGREPRTPQPPEPAPTPVKRPAQLVLILKNTGDRDAMKNVARVASRFAGRLIPEDSVSLITLLNGRHVWVFRDMSGDQAREEIERRVPNLFAIVKASPQAAVEDALRHLEQDPRPGKSSAVVVLSAADEDDTLNRWVEQVRGDAESHGRVLTASDDSNAGPQ